jgi:hypothetical protein
MRRREISRQFWDIRNVGFGSLPAVEFTSLEGLLLSANQPFEGAFPKPGDLGVCCHQERTLAGTRKGT